MARIDFAKVVKRLPSKAQIKGHLGVDADEEDIFSPREDADEDVFSSPQNIAGYIKSRAKASNPLSMEEAESIAEKFAAKIYDHPIDDRRLQTKEQVKDYLEGRIDGSPLVSKERAQEIVDNAVRQMLEDANKKVEESNKRKLRVENLKYKLQNPRRK